MRGLIRAVALLRQSHSQPRSLLAKSAAIERPLVPWISKVLALVLISSVTFQVLYFYFAMGGLLQVLSCVKSTNMVPDHQVLYTNRTTQAQQKHLRFNTFLIPIIRKFRPFHLLIAMNHLLERRLVTSCHLDLLGLTLSHHLKGNEFISADI
jgi:hypothetical protein